jgi:hypothetical protein
MFTRTKPPAKADAAAEAAGLALAAAVEGDVTLEAAGDDAAVAEDAAPGWLPPHAASATAANKPRNVTACFTKSLLPQVAGKRFIEVAGGYAGAAAAASTAVPLKKSGLSLV